MLIRKLVKDQEGGSRLDGTLESHLFLNCNFRRSVKVIWNVKRLFPNVSIFYIRLKPSPRLNFRLNLRLKLRLGIRPRLKPKVKPRHKLALGLSLNLSLSLS